MLNIFYKNFIAGLQEIVDYWPMPSNSNQCIFLFLHLYVSHMSHSVLYVVGQTSFFLTSQIKNS